MNKKNATLEKSSTNINGNNFSSLNTGKLASMLRHFSQGKRLHRFSAERLGDHCLHSTVSDLQARHYLTFARVWVSVPNRFGSETRVKLYWLEGDSLLAAQEIVNRRAAA